jgi:hypothetical protein
VNLLLAFVRGPATAHMHLRNKCTIQLNHITLLVIGMVALSICLSLRLLGAGDAWQQPIGGMLA